jgi:hypothetical protein
VGGAPAQVALGLGIRGAAQLGHHHHAHLPGEQPPDEPRDPQRLLGAQQVRQRRQPRGDGGGVIVDDVVDAPVAALAVDKATWARSRGWALSQALLILSYYTVDTKPTLVREARRWLATLLAEQDVHG